MSKDRAESSRRIERMDEDYLCAVADALRPDDEVFLNGRSRSVTVLGREEDMGHGVISGTDYPYKIVWLRGNGTEYRLRYSHLGDHYPHLHTESQLEARESYSIRHGEPRKYVQATCSGETVHRLSVKGVDEDDLTDWSLSRNLVWLEEDETA